MLQIPRPSPSSLPPACQTASRRSDLLRAARQATATNAMKMKRERPIMAAASCRRSSSNGSGSQPVAAATFWAPFRRWWAP